MQRAKQPAACATAAAIEDLLAPLARLVRAADEAKNIRRLPRALELYERALALAETTMPESTLLAAPLLQLIIGARLALAAGGSAAATTDNGAGATLYEAAWRDDEKLLRLSQRCLGLLRARWAAGTLMTTPTPEEAHFSAKTTRTPELLGVESFVAWAYDALSFWPVEAVLTLADGAQCLHGIHEALCAAGEMWTLAPGCKRSTLGKLHDVLQFVLDDVASGWLPHLRTTCGLSHADEAKLREILQEVAQGHSARQEHAL
jgi:hypothetical protein